MSLEYFGTVTKEFYDKISIIDAKYERCKLEIEQKKLELEALQIEKNKAIVLTKHPILPLLLAILPTQVALICLQYEEYEVCKVCFIFKPIQWKCNVGSCCYAWSSEFKDIERYGGKFYFSDKKDEEIWNFLVNYLKEKKQTISCQYKEVFCFKNVTECWVNWFHNTITLYNDNDRKSLNFNIVN